METTNEPGGSVELTQCGSTPSRKNAVLSVLIAVLHLGDVYKTIVNLVDHAQDLFRAGRLRSLGMLLSGGKSIYTGRQRLALASTVEFIEQHLPHVRSSRNRKELLTQALLAADLTGDRLICEFGVFKADSLNHLAALTAKPLYGFDSFEGLPNDQSDHWTKGRFAVDALPKVRENVTLIKGWFDETIPLFLQEHPGDVGFLHVDCDLYTSARIVFELLEDRLKPGAVIVFDEFFNYPSWKEGEYKAFQEFLARTNLGVEYLGYNRNGEQLALRLTANLRTAD